MGTTQLIIHKTDLTISPIHNSLFLDPELEKSNVPPAGWEIALTWILVRAPGYLTVSWLTRKPSWPGFKGFISIFRMDPRGNTNTPILEVFGRLCLQCNVRGIEGFGGFVVFGRATVLDWRIREFQTYWSMRGRYATILGVSITLIADLSG